MSKGHTKLWVGRFAPTPSGPLHFGSLVAALGSYLIARNMQGEWLVRIEDIDTPREIPGAADEILRTLEVFGFEWDREVVYQSQRHEYYRQALAQLKSDGLVYACDCSRKIVQQRSAGVYDNFCRNRQLTHSSDNALRIRISNYTGDFSDEVLGQCSFRQKADYQDFVIRRRDGLFAYQLAVVVDDIEQGVNQVVRGADILDSTPRQNFLYRCFKVDTPKYFHLPLVLDNKGNKLSKSRFSSAISADNASDWLVKALEHLGQNVEPEIIRCSPQEILRWAIENWRIENVGKVAKVFQPE